MGLNIFQSTVVWIFIIGYASLRYRHDLSRFFQKMPLPAWIVFLIVGTLFSILEESINCPPSGCALLPPTIPIFFGFLLINLGAMKLFRVRNFTVGILIMGLIGWLAEFLLGASQEVLWSDPLITAIMTVWVFATYSIIAIVPVTIFLDAKRT